MLDGRSIGMGWLTHMPDGRWYFLLPRGRVTVGDQAARARGLETIVGYSWLTLATAKSAVRQAYGTRDQ